MTAADVERHGTHAGWWRHRRAHEVPCAACQDAGPHDLAYARARRRALTQLSREYPQRFRELFAAYRNQGADSAALTAARREVLHNETAPRRTK